MVIGLGVVITLLGILMWNNYFSPETNVILYIHFLTPYAIHFFLYLIIPTKILNMSLNSDLKIS